jgi:hypothetical protein
MTIAEPLPDLQWGKGTWQDYISNWRTRDTNWMQERLILRYQTTALRGTAYPSPSAGQVTYNDETKSLEMWRAAPTSAWVRALMFQYLTSNKDDSAGVNLAHTGAAGKGVQLTPTSVLIDAPTTNFLNGVHVVDATGITVKVGTKTAKLSTDASNLVSDSPIKAPSGIIDAITTSGAISAGSISAASATLTNIGMSGTLSGGIVNGASGLIGGVRLGGAGVLANNAIADSGGFVSQQGYFYGTSNSGVVRQRNPSTGALGTAYLEAQAADLQIKATTGNIWMDGTTRFMGGRSVPWHNAAGTHVAYCGPVIYSGGDPGAGNFPDGTIWFS